MTPASDSSRPIGRPTSNVDVGFWNGNSQTKVDRAPPWKFHSPEIAILTRKNPPAHAAKTTHAATARAHRRRHSSQAITGRNRRAFEILENVAIPRISAAARSPEPPKSHRVPRGARSGDSTSLYSQQK